MQDGALDLPNYGNMCVVCYAGGQEVKIARAGTAWEQQWGGGVKKWFSRVSQVNSHPHLLS